MLPFCKVLSSTISWLSVTMPEFQFPGLKTVPKSGGMSSRIYSRQSFGPARNARPASSISFRAGGAPLISASFQSISSERRSASPVASGRRIASFPASVRNSGLITQCRHAASSWFGLRVMFTCQRGEAYPKPYYGLRIGQFLNSFRPDESSEGSYEERNGRYRVFIPTKSYNSGLAMSLEVIGSYVAGDDPMKSRIYFFRTGCRPRSRQLACACQHWSS